ncbi:hypothetical protein DITRI_Ditri13aG0118200 [Diplodiscus trichospermus]
METSELPIKGVGLEENPQEEEREGHASRSQRRSLQSPESAWVFGVFFISLFGWPLPLLKPPWFGGCCGGLLPFHGATKARAPLNIDANGEGTQVSKDDGNGIDRSP